MSRTVRLLELLVRLQTLRQFTVQALADEFGVSRRTMLRDLQSLSELGVPLAATSGPHGGYRLIREQQLPPLMLTADEAIALVVSYESLQQYADSPFDFDKSAAMAKIQGALPMKVLQRLGAVRAHLAMPESRKSYQAPYLRELLDAAIAKIHLRIRYDSRSGLSERIIFPYGLFPPMKCGIAHVMTTGAAPMYHCGQTV